MTNQEKDKLYKEFNDRFPISWLENMSIEDYCLGGDNKDSFSAWIEFKTAELGSVKGGSSYKHGIFVSKAKKEQKGYDKYSFSKKYGATAEAAFINIKQLVIKTAKASISGDYAAIDDIDFSPLIKRKIAFLYSNKQLLNIYKREALDWLADEYEISENISLLEASHELAKKIKKDNFFEGTKEMWKEWYGDDIVDDEEVKDIETQYDKQSEFVDKCVDILKSKKQIILQGAPGTGKTYTTAEIAVSICDDGDLPYTHEEVMERYEELRKERRIDFCTFHQSMDYEDFVEGLKPNVVTGENGENTIGLTYGIEDGIFKRMCENARQIKVESKHRKIDFAKSKVFKMSLGEVGTEEGDSLYDYCVENNIVALGWGDDIDFSACKEREDFRCICKDWGATALEIFKTWISVGDIIIVSSGNCKFRAIARVTGEYEYRTDGFTNVYQYRDVEWLYIGEDIPVNKLMDKKFSQQSIYGLYKTTSKSFANSVDTEFLNSIISGEIDQHKKNYVLIIDEINRGNVSKIFGELITLLESDKRVGENSTHPITVTLPYSKREFYVPDNLYIIGTMNTTDRSTGTIDYAVRRRFAFVTLQSNVELIRSTKARDLFEEVANFIDERKADINFELDDLMVGHSYFMTSNIDELKLKMEFEVIPLIKEYIKDGILIKKEDDDEVFEFWANAECYEEDDDDTID